MFGRSIKLFRLFGFEVRVDLSWTVIAVLITWSLATGVFPSYARGLSAATYWWMGAVGALGLFASVVVHELFHSLVARRFGITMRGITLFIFGGVAQMEDEPKSAQAEFFMAGAGPMTSIVLGVLFIVLYRVGVAAAWPLAVSSVIRYLGAINLILAAFNLVPAFPLDGGRVFRAIMWRIRKDIRSATRIASQVGSAFGLFLIVVGVVTIIRGSFIGGIWWALIGLFLRGAAGSSYQELLRRQTLQGESVRRIMRNEAVTVAPSVLVSQFVEDYIYRYHYNLFPLVDNGRLLGCVSTREVRDIPREQWALRRVGDLAATCSPGNTVSADVDALTVLQTMRRTGNTRLMVVEGDRLLGIITLKDLLDFIGVRLELGG